MTTVTEEADEQGSNNLCGVDESNCQCTIHSREADLLGERRQVNARQKETKSLNDTGALQDPESLAFEIAELETLWSSIGMVSDGQSWFHVEECRRSEDDEDDGPCSQCSAETVVAKYPVQSERYHNAASSAGCTNDAECQSTFCDEPFIQVEQYRIVVQSSANCVQDALSCDQLGDRLCERCADQGSYDDSEADEYAGSSVARVQLQDGEPERSGNV